MQSNYNQIQGYNLPAQGLNPNAVNINIIAPQAYGSGYTGLNSNCAGQFATNPYLNNPQQNNYQQNQNIYAAPYNPIYSQPYNSMYDKNLNNGQNYPQNYNNMLPLNNDSNKENKNSLDTLNERNLYSTDVSRTNNNTNEENTTKTKEEKKETKKITPLTDDYIKSLENYLNSENPKIRLLAAKEILERFKEDETRADNPSLIPLLNKILKDVSPSVRFLGLTMLQLGYSVGNDETVQILKQIQTNNEGDIGEDSILASEILLKLSAPQQVEIEKGGQQ